MAELSPDEYLYVQTVKDQIYMTVHNAWQRDLTTTSTDVSHELQDVPQRNEQEKELINQFDLQPITVQLQRRPKHALPPPPPTSIVTRSNYHDASSSSTQVSQ